MKYTPDEIAELLKDKPHQPHYIAAMVRKAVEAERERCAALCDSLPKSEMEYMAQKMDDRITAAQLEMEDAAADEIDMLRARVAELEAQERGGWIRTSGWSNELYSFDRSDNEDGTFALTVSERDGKRLVEIDRLTASDLERIVDVVGDGVVYRPVAEIEREACAKVCEERYQEYYCGVITEHPCYASSMECAAAIRARGDE